MYLNQLRHEQLADVQAWMAISRGASRLLRRVGVALGFGRDVAEAVFVPHRVPDADKLR